MNTNKTHTEQLTQDAVMQSVLKNQVRIGNFVDFDGQIETVYAIRNSGVDFYRGKTKKSVIMQSYVWEAIKPIPLTEEWLNKLGYYLISERHFANIGHLVWELDGRFYCDKNGIQLKYVHQLQNLYFALTQRELTVA